MIDWYFGTFFDVFRGRDERELEGCLGSRELVEFQRLKVPKRRDEWLASRLAVKALVRHHFSKVKSIEDRQIETIKEPSGVPHVQIDGRAMDEQLSLSHSEGRVFCALAETGHSLGVDLERIQMRPPEFIQDYFTDKERQMLTRLPPERQPLLATLIWSAKEAVLKALSLGLSLDTRSVEIHLNMEESLSPRVWQPLEFTCAARESSSLRLYWRKEDDFVLTLCTPEMLASS